MKNMTLKEFYETGLLQEVNRQFLHPLGLAIAFNIDEKANTFEFDSIHDFRDDPEGVRFDPEYLTSTEALAKTKNVEFLAKNKAAKRMELLGWIIQPTVVKSDNSL